MPIDTKRIQGPESSTPYDLFCEKKDEDQPGENLSSQRNDGRKNDLLREIFLKTDVISQAKGSAYLEMNKTKVICSVFDPREIPRKSNFSVNGEIYCEFKYAPYSSRRRRGHQQDAEEKQMSVHLKRALEPAVCRHEFPNLQVDVYVLVLESDGSALAASITCAGLALADASIPMFDLVVGVSMGVTCNGMKFTYPTLEEEAVCCVPPEDVEGSFGTISAGFLPSLGQMSQVVQDGSMDMTTFRDLIKELTDISREAYKLSQECLVKSIKQAKERKIQEVKN